MSLDRAHWDSNHPGWLPELEPDDELVEAIVARVLERLRRQIEEERTEA